MIVKYNNITINDDYADIKLIQNNKEYHLLIDKEDINRIVNNSIILDNTGYCSIYITTFKKDKEKTIIRMLLHLYILNRKYNTITKEVCDHINRNKLDNRKSNLRITSHKINRINSKSKGYYYDKHGKRWRAFIKINGKYLYFDCKTEQEAKEKREYLLKLYFPTIFS